PSKRIALDSLIYLRITFSKARSFFVPFLICLSTSVLNSISWLATMALRTIIGNAEFAEEPTARNSNLLPVNANGEVRLRSVLSSFKSGILGIPCHKLVSFLTFFATRADSTSSRISSNCEPKNIEIIAGGASFAPKRWSLLWLAMDARSKSACSYTALMVLTKNVRNIRLFFGVLPGESRLMPVLVINDQLLCLPDPLIPLKGFSCNNTLKWCRPASWYRRFINIWL